MRCHSVCRTRDGKLIKLCLCAMQFHNQNKGSDMLYFLVYITCLKISMYLPTNSARTKLRHSKWSFQSSAMVKHHNIPWYFNSTVVFLLLTESFDVAAFTVYSVLMNVNDLFTLTHFHLFQNMYYVSTDSLLYS